MFCQPSCRRFLLAISVFCVAAATAATGTAQSLEIGSPAPDFNLPGVDGKQHTLQEFRDADVLAVIFTCNHCPTAQAYEDRIKQLAADYKDKKVAVVAVSPNDPLALRLDELGYTDVSDSLEDMKIRAKERNFTFPYLYDGENQKVSRAYGPLATPHVFVFDRARTLRFTGRIDNSDHPQLATSRDTRNAIDALLAGRPVPVEKTKVFGCSTKWSDKRESAKKSLETWAKEDVTLKLLDEQGIKTLAKNDGKNLRLVKVWATWCGPCVEELPEFVTINRMYRHRGLELMTISADAPAEKEKTLDVLKRKQVAAANYVFDGTDPYKLMEAIDKESSGPVPYTVLIAPGGKVLYRKSGSCDALAIKKAIVGYLGRTYK